MAGTTQQGGESTPAQQKNGSSNGESQQQGLQQSGSGSSGNQPQQGSEKPIIRDWAAF